MGRSWQRRTSFWTLRNVVPVATHSSSVEHRGSFAHAVCSCGWRGPGRRSISKAAVDADAHEAVNAGDEAGVQPEPEVTESDRIEAEQDGQTERDAQSEPATDAVGSSAHDAIPQQRRGLRQRLGR